MGERAIAGRERKSYRTAAQYLIDSLSSCALQRGSPNTGEGARRVPILLAPSLVPSSKQVYGSRVSTSRVRSGKARGETVPEVSRCSDW